MGTVDDWRMHGEKSPCFAEYLALCHHANFGPLIDTSDKVIDKDDALIIVDMQNDFIPKDAVNPYGRLPSTEGGDIAGVIVQMAELIADRGGLVVATRDYHPANHASFIEQGGSCLPHCVQGNPGSDFYKPIGDCLEKLLKAEQRVEIVFKGIHTDVESFGSFTYSEVPPADRGGEFCMTKDWPECRCHGSSKADWTGSFCMPCSNFKFEGEVNVNAPPDVTAVYDREPLADVLRKQGIKRLFVCGLVFDLCVIDTSLNALKAGFADTFLVLDAARPIHVPGLGKIGSGFMNPLEPMQKRMMEQKLRLVPTAALIPGFSVVNPLASGGAAKAVFPLALGPFKLVSCQAGVRLDLSQTTYKANPPKYLARVLRTHAMVAEGTCSPKVALTLSAAAKQAAQIPEAAISFVWVNPLKSLASLRDNAQVWLPTKSAAAAFFVYGGFIYLDKANRIIAEKAVNIGMGLSFRAPVAWKQGYAVAITDRWTPATIPFLVGKGVKLFAWINPGEVLEVSGRDPWEIPAEHGAFAYLYHEDLAAADDRDVFFPVEQSAHMTPR
mmetsp:Transcript_35566/g.65849  ORF Transcript_35566/g.65849 Transcript_35566/m.65849 type:complete len:554 (+) Transcript_35566:76-1737(+)